MQSNTFPDEMRDSPKDEKWKGILKMYMILALLFLVMFTMRATVTILQVFVPDLSTSFKVTEGTVAIAFTIYNLTSAVISLLVGPLSERFGYKVMIYIGMLIFSLGIGLSSFAWEFWIFAIAQALAGVGAACFGPANIAFAGDYFPEERRTSAIGLIMSAFFVSSIIAVPINSYVADILDWQWGVRIMAIIAFLIFVLTLFFIPKRKQILNSREEEEKSIEQSRIEINITNISYIGRMKLVLSNKYALGTFFITLFQRGGLFGMTTLLTSWLKESFGLEKTEAGLIFMGAGIAALISNSIFSYLADKVGKKIIIIAGTALTGIWAGIFPLISVTLTSAIICIIVFNFFGGISMGSYNTHITEVAPESKGTALAINNTFGQLSIAIIVALLGKGIYDKTGEYFYCGLVTMGIYFICVIMMLFIIKGRKNMYHLQT
ncbi:MAG: MFS transporter [Candidatus Thorarchaeota archaeon]